MNIPANLISANESTLTTTPPPSIIEPQSTTSYQTHSNAEETTIVSNLSPLPDERRSSMDEYFFSSVNLPVPKQFADAASRRSSGVEPIQEEEGNGHSIASDTKLSIETEYNYDVGYLCGSDDANCESAVPYEVYERNLLRSATMQQCSTIYERDKSEESIATIKQVSQNIVTHTLQVPTISMSDVDMMERNPITTAETTITVDNVYTSENMTIIDTDHVVKLISYISLDDRLVWNLM